MRVMRNSDLIGGFTLWTSWLLTAVPGTTKPARPSWCWKNFWRDQQIGAATETLYLRNYKIKHCLGCYSCWLQTPGRCVQKDDMSEESVRPVSRCRPGGAGYAHLSCHHERPHEALYRAHHAHDGSFGGSARRGPSPSLREDAQSGGPERGRILGSIHVSGPVPYLAHVPGRGTSSPKSSGILPNSWFSPSFSPRQRRCWPQWLQAGKEWCARARSIRPPWPPLPNPWPRPRPCSPWSGHLAARAGVRREPQADMGKMGSGPRGLL